MVFPKKGSLFGPGSLNKGVLACNTPRAHSANSDQTILPPPSANHKFKRGHADTARFGLPVQVTLLFSLLFLLFFILLFSGGGQDSLSEKAEPGFPMAKAVLPDLADGD